MITGLIGIISTVMGSTFTESTIYWITRMDYFQGVGFLTSILLLIGSIICLIIGSVLWDDTGKKKVFITGLLSTITSLLLIIGACFIPSTKEMCAIKAIPAIVNNEEVQELPNKVVELANEWIDAQRTNFVDELKPSKESK